MHDLYPTLTPLFREVFDDPTLELRPTLCPEDVPVWDSLATVRLMLAVETTFNFQFDVQDLEKVQDVAALEALIRQHLEARGA